MRLTDSAGNKIGYLPVDLSDGEETDVFVLTVTPADGFTFLATPSDADVQIQARETGSGDPFVDLSTGIELSSYTPETSVDFDVKVVADDPLTGIRRVVIYLAVTNSEAAGWAA